MIPKFTKLKNLQGSSTIFKALLRGQVFLTAPPKFFSWRFFIKWEAPDKINHNRVGSVGHVRTVQDLIIPV